ncbi:MAG: hypothetical protein HY841_11745 [Bacteroidetes bacterium]|nr:hypothetical protein [Bacteroidota bacterium]
MENKKKIKILRPSRDILTKWKKDIDYRVNMDFDNEELLISYYWNVGYLMRMGLEYYIQSYLDKKGNLRSFLNTTEREFLIMGIEIIKKGKINKLLNGIFKRRTMKQGKIQDGHNI